MGDLPRVTVELDGGPYEAVIAYVAVGVPAYSDVPSVLAGRPTEAEAERSGITMLSVGNWSSFHVEKRYIDGPSNA